MSVRRTAAVGLLLASACWAASGVAQQVDPDTGLVVAEGWELVHANCIVCHSLALVTAQRGDRDHWLAILHTMQTTHNMWPLQPGTEAKIADYLAAHYSAELGYARRPPLPAELLPPSAR